MVQSFSGPESFYSADEAAWWEAVDKALKGSPRARLYSRTDDDLDIAPLYEGRTDTPARALRKAGADWTIVQRIDLPDIKAANAQILEDLGGGAGGVEIVLRNAQARVPDGLALSTQADFAALFKNVLPDLITTRLHGPDSLSALELVLRSLQAAGADCAAVDIVSGFDPNTTLDGSSQDPEVLSGYAEGVRSAIAVCGAAGSRARVLCADGGPWHNRGASPAQELGLVMASLVTHLRTLETIGVPLELAVQRVSLSIVADADQFGTISKARAVRRLWASVIGTLVLEQLPAHLHMTTSNRMLTKSDPWVNLLRNTVAAFAAGIGGADSVCVLPHTLAVGLPDALARRLARNTQAILLEESNLARVIDPAAGSGAVETRTDQLCAAAWAVFQDIEAKGGLPAAIADGSVTAQIFETRTRQENDVARRKRPITGVSEFPNLAETAVEVLQERRSDDGVYRYAAPFETLRAAADSHASATGAPPKVFMASLGSLAEFTARATWTANAFAAGGLAVEGGGVFTSLDDLVAAFDASGAEIACLVSSDAVYESEAEAAASALKASGARHVSMAGKPGEREADYREAGVDTFVFAGCDILSFLREAHAVLGINAHATETGQEVRS